MTRDDADHDSELAHSSEPSLLAQLLTVLCVPILMLAAPVIWLQVIGEDPRPDKVAPWISAAVSLAAVLWAIGRARVDSARRLDDQNRAERQRLADAQIYQERRDEERRHDRATAAATVIGIVRQSAHLKSNCTKFSVNVEIRNAGQHPVLEVSIDALWLMGRPVAYLEPYVLHPADPEGIRVDRQIQVLEEQ